MEEKRKGFFGRALEKITGIFSKKRHSAEKPKQPGRKPLQAEKHEALEKRRKTIHPEHAQKLSELLPEPKHWKPAEKKAQKLSELLPEPKHWKPAEKRRELIKEIEAQESPVKEAQQPYCTQAKQFQQTAEQAEESNAWQGNSARKIIATDFDALQGFIDSKGKTTIAEASKNLGLKPSRALECAQVLEKNSLIELNYPAIGSPQLFSKSFKEEKLCMAEKTKEEKEKKKSEKKRGLFA